MATEAQITANRTNAQDREPVRPYPRNAEAQGSTPGRGPASIAGRARVSHNALTNGLYSSADFVRPEEQDLYVQFCAGFQADLAPRGAIEQTLSAEIIHAAWRLRRCSVIEAAMVPIGDDSQDPLLEKTQQSIDRARANAHRIFHRSMAELRRVQSEREPVQSQPVKRRKSPFTKQTQFSPAVAAMTARNAPCTCGSGVKFKRCCGQGAPAILNRAA